MKINLLIEKYFWAFLLAGILTGLWQPVVINAPDFVPKLLMGINLFLVFLKIDSLRIIENLGNLKLMVWIASAYMLFLPVLFYFLINIFDNELALGMLLLTSMPAGISIPVLTDLVKGNVPLSMSLAIVTQLVAPVTIPFLFWLIGGGVLHINKLQVFRDIAMLVFVPMILAQLAKRLLPGTINKTKNFFTSINVVVLFSFVYIVMSSQRDVILSNPASLIWKTVVIYAVFISLHIIGYMIGYRQPKENRITLSVGAAYMNNGLAIVLAATYFSPGILALMILSELPWNTLPGPFKRIVWKL